MYLGELIIHQPKLFNHFLESVSLTEPPRTGWFPSFRCIYVPDTTTQTWSAYKAFLA